MTVIAHRASGKFRRRTGGDETLLRPLWVLPTTHRRVCVLLFFSPSLLLSCFPRIVEGALALEKGPTVGHEKLSRLTYFLAQLHLIMKTVLLFVSVYTE